MGDPRKRSDLGEAYRAASPYLTLGIQFATVILLCVFAGRWVDRRFDTAPIFTLAGGILGIVAGFYHFLKTVLSRGKKPEDNA